MVAFVLYHVSLSSHLAAGGDIIIGWSANLLFQIFLNVPHKLISAAGKFTENSINSRLGGMPVLFRDIETMHGADDKIHIRKCHLIEHQTAASMKCLSDNHSGFYLNTALVNNLSREKSIVTSVPGFVLANNGRSRYIIFQKYIYKEFAIGMIITVVNLSF